MRPRINEINQQSRALESKKGQWKRQILDRIEKSLSKNSQESAFLAASVMLCFFNMHGNYLWKEILVKILRVIIKTSCVISLWMCGGINLSFRPKCGYFFVFSDTSSNPEKLSFFPLQPRFYPQEFIQMGKKRPTTSEIFSNFFSRFRNTNKKGKK